MKSPIDMGVVLITGASSGIGMEMARLLALRAKALVLLARRTERLEALAIELRKKAPNLIVLVTPCDLSDPAACDAMLERVNAEAGPVDVLINNAGFGDVGVFDLVNWDRMAKMIALNVTALTYLCHRLVAGMVERGRGGVLNVSSGFGLTFGPGMAVYIGTKHFVTGFSEGLRLDLAGTGVRVTQVCPGPVATEFLEQAGNFTGLSMPGIVEISAERCARTAIAAFDKGRALVVPGILIRFLIFMGARTPRWILRLMYRPAASALRRKQLALLAAKGAKQ